MINPKEPNSVLALRKYSRNIVGWFSKLFQRLLSREFIVNSLVLTLYFLKLSYLWDL